MNAPIIAFIGAAVGLVLLRHYAARRVIARQGQFVWLMFVPTLIGPIAIAWAAVQQFRAAPVFGAILAACALGYGAVLVRFLMRLSRSVSSAPPDQDVRVVATDVYADHLVGMLGFILLSGLVAMVGLIVWAVTR